MGEGRGALKGLGKGEGELVRAKKGEKGQDIGGGRRGGILKRVKRAKERELQEEKGKNKSIYSGT